MKNSTGYSQRLTLQNQVYLKRNFPADYLRGCALIVMMVHHLGFDLHNLFMSESLAFTDSYWFDGLLRPFVVAIFVYLAGVSTHYSRHVRKHAYQLLGIAFSLTVLSIIISQLTKSDNYIYFQVLHVVGCGLLLTDILHLKQRRYLTVSFIVISFIFNSYVIDNLGLQYVSPLFIPLGFGLSNVSSMADYLPLFPWLGIFWLGVISGNCHLWQRRGVQLKYYSPVALLGRHSLVVYLVHQPIFILVLYLYFALL